MKKRHRKRHHKHYLGYMVYEIEYSTKWREVCSALEVGEYTTINREKLMLVRDFRLNYGILKYKLMFVVKKIPTEVWVPESVKEDFISLCISSEEFPSIRRIITYYHSTNG